MPAIWNGTLSTSRCEPLSLPGLAWPIELRTHPRAKSLRLRLDEARERLVLTVPRRVSRSAALQWAEGQSRWVEQQVSRLQAGEPLRPGSLIPIAGNSIHLRWDAGLSRAPILIGNVLQCGGAVEAFSGRIERFLRAEARRRLSLATMELAQQAGVSVRTLTAEAAPE